MFVRALSISSVLLLASCAAQDQSNGSRDSGTLYDGSQRPADAGWYTHNDSSGGSLSLEGTQDENGYPALRVQGDGFSEWGSSINLPIPDDSDIGASVGISFWIRGTHPVRFSASTLDVIPQSQGGTCADGCWNAHGTPLSVSSDWKQVILRWTDLRQEPGWGTMASFDPARVRLVSWTINTPARFDLWLTDVVLVFDPSELPTGNQNPGTGGSPGSGGSGNDTGSGGTTNTGGTGAGGTTNTGGTGGGTFNPENALGKYVSAEMFSSAFPQRSGMYRYQSLLDAVAKFPQFASCCNETEQKREIAAFLAHVTHETGHLRYVNEVNPPEPYCDTKLYMCPAASYHGRGAMQLSWNYNYAMAYEYLSANQGLTTNLLQNPDAVSSSTELVWTTALWFWMVGEPNTISPHDHLRNGGFGATTMKINGGKECGPHPENPQGSPARIGYYQEWCARLGVDPGSNLGC